MIEHILSELTGLGATEPEIAAGPDYESPRLISFEDGKFFIWHSVPSEKVKAQIISANAKPIFLIRNIYDLVVSQYFHFANDVDAEIGHPTNTQDYFAEMSQDEGIALLLSGATSERFHWSGFGQSLRQIQEILKFAKEQSSHIVIYDRLVRSKRQEIQSLANFLSITPNEELINQLVDTSSLSNMREARKSAVGSGNHFRKGIPGDHVNVLKPFHYHMINWIMLSQAPELKRLCADLDCSDVVLRSR